MGRQKHSRLSAASEADVLPGRVTASYGRRFLVELPDGEVLDCVTHGKKGGLVVNDAVRVARTGPGQGVVEKVEPRRSLLWRSDAFQQKMIAANVTQMVAVVAPYPSFYAGLLNRCLLAAEAAGIRAVIVLNKIDLPEAGAARQQLARYEALGYPLVALSARQDISPLEPWLQSQTSVLVGQSGMGKSSIINALLPDVRARTNDISDALNSGKHTTTHAQLYHLDADSDLIDSPGLQEFGLNHLDEGELFQAFVEFRPFLGQCRFANCRHDHEPGCAIRVQVEGGAIDAERHALWLELIRALTAARSQQY